MKEIDPGHKYLVDSYDGGKPIEIKFMKRVGEGYPGNIGRPHGGTNCQEVLRVLICRTRYLNGQIPSKHNDAVIRKLQECLWLFEDRAATRHGIDQFDWRPDDIESAPHCLVCGHVICEGH
jgi:hypothetical protein